VIRAVTIIYFGASAFSVVDDPTEPSAAAKAIGLTISDSFLLLADEVIE